MTRDWDAEQQSLQHEQEAALAERIRLKPPHGVATPEALSLFSDAVKRHEAARGRLSAFLAERIKLDPDWRAHTSNGRTVSRDRTGGRTRAW